MVFSCWVMGSETYVNVILHRKYFHVLQVVVNLLGTFLSMKISKAMGWELGYHLFVF